MFAERGTPRRAVGGARGSVHVRTGAGVGPGRAAGPRWGSGARERRSPAVARSGVRAAAGQLSQATGTAQMLSFWPGKMRLGLPPTTDLLAA